MRLSAILLTPAVNEVIREARPVRPRLVARSDPSLSVCPAPPLLVLRRKCDAIGLPNIIVSHMFCTKRVHFLLPRLHHNMCGTHKIA